MAKILLVDDNGILRRAIRKALELAGHEVCEAANGIEALHCFAQTQYDLVITDLIMPDKEGIETIIAIKKQASATRIIAISGDCAFDPSVYFQAALTLGADRVLAKPFTGPELQQAVKEVLTQPQTAEKRFTTQSPASHRPPPASGATG